MDRDTIGEPMTADDIRTAITTRQRNRERLRTIIRNRHWKEPTPAEINTLTLLERELGELWHKLGKLDDRFSAAKWLADRGLKVDERSLRTAQGAIVKAE